MEVIKIITNLWFIYFVDVYDLLAVASGFERRYFSPHLKVCVNDKIIYI